MFFENIFGEVQFAWTYYYYKRSEIVQKYLCYMYLPIFIIKEGKYFLIIQR